MFSTHIAQSDVHTSYISCVAVNHHNFSVIAIIHTMGQPTKMYGKKSLHSHSAFTQHIKETSRHRPAPYIVINHSHVHTPLHGIEECVTEQTPHGIVFHDEIFQMDVMPGSRNVFQ